MPKCNFCNKEGAGVQNENNHVCICRACIKLAVKALKDPLLDPFQVISLEAYKAFLPVKNMEPYTPIA